MERVQSVERAVKLIEAVASRPKTMSALARQTELPLSTVSRLLGTLEDLDTVVRDSQGLYLLGPSARSMLSTPVAASTLDAVAQPYMQNLAESTGEAVALSIPLGHDSVTIRQMDNPQAVRVQDWIGSRWPLTAGGSGLVMMATWPSSRIDEILAEPLRACTPSTITDPAEIRLRLGLVADSRLWWTHGEYVPEVSSVASAILGPRDEAVAALICYGPSYRFPPPSGQSRIEVAVTLAAEQVSTDIQAMGDGTGDQS